MIYHDKTLGEFEINCETCFDTKKVQVCDEDDMSKIAKTVPCPDCCKDYYEQPVKLEE